jgi:subtilisin family serine protease
MPNQAARQYVVFDETHLREFLNKQQGQQAIRDEPRLPLTEQDIRRVLAALFEGIQVEQVSVPLVTFVAGDEACQLQPTQGVFALTPSGPDAARRFSQAILQQISGVGEKEDAMLLRVGVDPALALSEYSIPVGPGVDVVGTWQNASILINAQSLAEQGLDGEGVNVVVVDAGFDKTILDGTAATFGGGWHINPGDPQLPPSLDPGMTTGLDGLHGMMVVNNILALAPRARIFDVPLIRPPKIGDVLSFMDLAEETYRRILEDIPRLAENCGITGQWVFVNAWTIYDRRSELPDHLGEYTENIGQGGAPHPFIARMRDVTAEYDVVFCAGNCGEVCPDDRCGPNDFGPGRSIWGAAAYQRVLCVGAVRVDGAWCGYSSEGPGPYEHLSYQKPDFCAPSQFASARGGFPLSSGTSAAAAVAAGVVAALRSEPAWDQVAVRPEDLQQSLNSSARRPTPITGWGPKMGWGILDAGAAYDDLSTFFPP